MSRLWGICAILVIALGGGRARAEDERVPEAQRRYEAGMASYHLEEYDKAIEEWEAGYRLKPAPQFLYNIAQAYRLSKRPEKALGFYQKYLKLAPKAANRVEVERHIEALTKVVEQQKQAAERPSQQPMPLKNDVQPSPPPPPAPVASDTSSTAPHADLTARAPEPHKPVYKKGWFWGVLVGGVVVAAGAVTLGVLLSRPASEQALPAARF
jgi:tetratricopeptide (TPR) repeat protein